MRSEHCAAETICATSSSKALYWSIGQMLAHLTSNGSNLVVGELCGSGTLSGQTPQELGSLLEKTLNGSSPLTLTSGEERSFLDDGDRVILTGRCDHCPGPKPVTRLYDFWERLVCQPGDSEPPAPEGNHSTQVQLTCGHTRCACGAVKSDAFASVKTPDTTGDTAGGRGSRTLRAGCIFATLCVVPLARTIRYALREPT